MKNLLNSVKVPKVNKSFFDMSFEHKTTFNMGKLIPISAVSVVPSDRITVGVDSLIRFQPMLAPLMHLVNVYTHTFFVPYRLLWRGTTQNNRWNDFIANIKTLGVLPVVPFLRLSEAAPGTLSNYLLACNDMNDNTDIVAFNHAAYQCICNEFYRDENLMDEIPYLLTDGNNSTNTDLFTLRNRCWEKDYFTAALPFAQKGDPVAIPIGQLDDVQVQVNNMAVPNTVLDGTPNDATVGTGTSSNPDINDDWLFAQTSALDIGSTTINDLRLAYTLQRWYEQLARGGTRPNEFLKVMFNVQSRDARLQRPEYICGSKSPVMISEVLNTTGTDTAPQGSMAGHGVGITKGKQGSFFVEEFGVVMTVMSVLPKTAYYQGIPKDYLKLNDPTEYFMPTFDHLGEQEVKYRELMATHGTPDDTFGYVPRYCEYKYPTNKISGDFQASLNFWHMGRDLPPTVALNDTFVQADPTTRIFAVEDIESMHLLASVWNDIKIVRPMSKYSTPTF